MSRLAARSRFYLSQWSPTKPHIFGAVTLTTLLVVTGLYWRNLAGVSSSSLFVFDEPAIDRHLAQHAGIYQDDYRPPHSRSPVYLSEESKKKTFLYTTTNFAFMDFTVNALCTAAEVGRYDITVIAQDHEAKHALRALGIPSLHTGTDFGQADAAGGSLSWGEGAYDALIRQRIYLLLDILEKGYNILFSDVDIVWSGDPSQDIYEGIDFEYQAEGTAVPWSGMDIDDNMGCMGFFYMRSSPQTISFVRDILDSFEHENLRDDQHMTFDVVGHLKVAGKALYVSKPFSAAHIAELRSSKPDMLLTTEFPLLKYSPGQDWYTKGAQFPQAWASAGYPSPAVPVMAHANWLVGKAAKIKALQSIHKWKIDDKRLERYLARFDKGQADSFPSSQDGDAPSHARWQDFCT